MNFFWRIILSALGVIFLLASYYINITAVIGSWNKLMDFGSFIAAGQLSLLEINPYIDKSPLIFSVTFSNINHSGVAPNLNPPISVLIFEQLSFFSPLVTTQIWRGLSSLFYIFAFIIFLKNRDSTNPVFLSRALWMFGLAGFWHTIELGQIYTLLLLLSVGIFTYTKKKLSFPAGLLLGLLIAVKPNFIFWAMALLAAGYIKIFIIAGLTALIVSLIPIYVYGIKIYEQWFEASKIFTQNLLVFPGNNSFQGLTARFDAAATGIFLSVILVAIFLFIIKKQKPAIQTIHTLSIIISLLISPIAWTGYTILLLPYFMSLKKWDITHHLVASIFMVPFYIILIYFDASFFNFVFLGWFYGWGLILLLIKETRNIILT